VLGKEAKARPKEEVAGEKDGDGKIKALPAPFGRKRSLLE
jgi:hypothetical protein